MKLTLDTSFLVVHKFSRDPETLSKARRVLTECRRKDNSGLMPSIVVGEFYAQSQKRAGREVAEKNYRELVESGLTIVNLDAEMARQAATFRIKYREKIPWGDCIIAACAFLNHSDFILSEDDHFKMIKEVKMRHLAEIAL